MRITLLVLVLTFIFPAYCYVVWPLSHGRFAAATILLFAIYLTAVVAAP
jgi:hypothetical protein